jgi:hypothetical protein
VGGCRGRGTPATACGNLGGGRGGGGEGRCLGASALWGRGNGLTASSSPCCARWGGDGRGGVGVVTGDHRWGRGHGTVARSGAMMAGDRRDDG